MEIPGVISLLKLLISIQQLILISELIPILGSILIPLPEQTAIPSSITIPEPIPYSGTYSDSRIDPRFNSGIVFAIDSEHEIGIA